MNVYVYSGKDLYRMESNLHSFLKDHEISKDNVHWIDGSDVKNFRMESVLMECDTLSLFEEDAKKAVIVKNPFFLNASAKEEGKILKSDSASVQKRKKKELALKEARLSLLEQYLKQPDKNTQLIFYCHGFDADSRKKDYKLLEEYRAVFLSFNVMREKEFNAYADQEIRKAGFRLDPDARRELLARVSMDTLQLHNALEKMKLYGEKNLCLNDIRHLVSLNPEINVFALASCFIKGDMAGAIAARDEMLNANYDYMALIAMIASRLKALYNMKKLEERGMREEDIAIRLHANKWAVHFGLQDCRSLNSDQMLKLLKELADLDQGIKAGTIQPKDGFDAYLLKNGKRN